MKEMKSIRGIDIKMSVSQLSIYATLYPVLYLCYIIPSALFMLHYTQCCIYATLYFIIKDILFQQWQLACPIRA